MTAQPLKTAPVKPDPLWEKRLQLAEELDAQGIYPPAWTQAQRAPWRDQEAYRRSGTYDADRHFLAAGQLYGRAHPALTPSRAQAEESLKAYVGEPRKPLAETIPVHEVPLQHPVGQPYLPTSKADAEEKAKLLARQNVNHLTWHDGDALPGHLDQWIKANGYKTGDIYQGPDGHHYRHNEITRSEAPDVVALRLKHSGEQTMQEIADGPDLAEPHVVRQITDDWLKEARSEQRGLNAHKAQAETPAPTTHAPDTREPANDNKPTAASPSIPENVAQKVRETASALDKLKTDAALSPSQFEILSHLQNRLDQAGYKVELRDIDPKTLIPTVEKLATKGATLDPHIGTPLLLGTAAAGTAELAGAGAASALPEIVATILAPEIVIPALLAGGAGLLVKYGTPPDGTKGAGRVWATKQMPPITKVEAANQNQSANWMRVQSAAAMRASTLAQLNSGLKHASDVTIFIGNQPVFKQAAHTSATDQILLDAFIKVAQDRGCLPKDPNELRKQETKNNTFERRGGANPQKRIGDPYQDGNLGSTQPDGSIKWTNPDGSVTAPHFNTTTTSADSVSEIKREIDSAKKTIENIMAHLDDSNAAAIEKYTTPVAGRGPLYLFGKKWNWSLDEIRAYAQRKIDGIFDKHFKDCKYIGEIEYYKLDDLDDPEIKDRPKNPGRKR